VSKSMGKGVAGGIWVGNEDVHCLAKGKMSGVRKVLYQSGQDISMLPYGCIFSLLNLVHY